MQNHGDPAEMTPNEAQPTRIRPTRLIRNQRTFTAEMRSIHQKKEANAATPPPTPRNPLRYPRLADTPRPGEHGEVPDEPLNDNINTQSTAHLMQLSGMMKAIRIPKRPISAESLATDDILPTEEEEYWPRGIKQTGPLPVVNLYGREPFGRTLPQIPVVRPEEISPLPGSQPAWKTLLNSPL